MIGHIDIKGLKQMWYEDVGAVFILPQSTKERVVGNMEKKDGTK
jgi:hypothetical protein